ncbi:aromatic ring-hydroxylating dioxygenase subunit alpha [Limibaculum sp. M0105]|uniref:Aromatic ring-hydroxylating dioxygenase subunit alpha n=1 Tax=Thermohalobaculum xanthum TaxID=2753746 RepID=A0A8J7M665_9RHOB|nr:aromatic ring-hydroxylating dioxygenase subunit alpha [Thermohalobaculum xanthum]MBK0399184.1 aromatic ring-hydroxylating dioxygenase subunit alpha [Thermohalobaculum xanthum]
MSGETPFHREFNGLVRAEPSLPVAWYSDPAHHEHEMATIWGREWLVFCRASELAPGGWRAGAAGEANIVAIRREDGSLAAFHNVCRHRGAEICPHGTGRLERPLLVCPYHRWAYDLSGRLIATGPARRVEGFDRGAHGLVPAGVAEWGGLVFVNPAGGGQAEFDAATARDLSPVANWPLGALEPAHREEIEIACNWKVFWENFNECLHCPGIHPALCELVPIYGRGIMERADDPDWRARAEAAEPRFAGTLAEGAETWAVGGKAQGAALPGLTPDEIARGHSFGVALPSFYVVAHVDHARVVRVAPVGPTRTRLTAEWLLPPGRAAEPGFDLDRIVAFARQVMAEDAAACEMNQRGLSTAPFAQGTLMQEEYEVHAFHRWVRARLAAAQA